MKQVKVFPALALGALLALSGCTSMRDLAPAFKANHANVADLTTSTSSLLAAIRPLVESAWNSEIESRRTAVLEELQAMTSGFRDADFTGTKIDSVLADDQLSWKADYHRLALAVSGAASEAEKDRLQSLHPVLAGIASMDVSTAQVAAHAKLLRSGQGVANIRSQVADAYPHVARALRARADTLARIDAYTASLTKQLQLASTHAELFDFAAQSNVNIEKAVAGLISDQGLQGQVLGLIKDDRWKSSATEALGLVQTVLSSDAAKEARK